MRIVLISDSHVTAKTSCFSENLKAARQWIEAMRPDHVVHLGDITADGVADPAEFALAWALFDGMAIPMHWLPGNHDIGDNLGSAKEPPIDGARLADFRAAFGADYWSFEALGWRIIGLNALLIGSGLPEERAQSDWLDRMLETRAENLGVMLHKPFFRNSSDDREEHVRYLPVAARLQMEQRLAAHNVRFVAAGHTHQLRRLRFGGIEHVWVPSIAFVIPDSLQETVGRKIVGAMVLELTEDGYSFAFVEPPFAVQHNLRDFPDVYPELLSHLRGQ